MGASINSIAMNIVSISLKVISSLLVFITFVVLVLLQANVIAQSTSATTQHNMALHGSPNEGGPRRFQVVGGNEINISDTPSPESSTITVTSQGTILNNLGCEFVADQIWCKVQGLKGKTRGFMPVEFLIPATGPDGAIPMGIDDSSRRVRKGDFDASDQILCAQVLGQAMSECSIQIARNDGGDASAVVTFSNGFKRTLYFEHGSFTSANATMSGVGTDTDWRLKDGFHFIRVDDQRYEIPDSIIVENRLQSE